MLCRFTNNTTTRMDDLQASCTWRTPAGGDAGEATVFVPHASPVASRVCIDPNGGSSLVIESKHGGGHWRGVITRLQFSETGITVTAHQPWILLGRRNVRGNLTVKNFPAGWIVGAALSDTLAGLPLHQSTGFFEGAGPLIDAFTFSRQSAWSVLAAMMDASDGELHVDPDTGRVDWCGPFAYASRYAPLLVAGDDVHGVNVTVDGMARVSEVIATHGTASYLVNRGEAASGGWKAQVVTSAPAGGTTLANKARTTLEATANPSVILTGGVPAEHWGIRERAFLRALIPYGGFDGLTVSARVLERTISDAAPLMDLRCQVVGADTVLPQLAIVTRERPDVGAVTNVAQTTTILRNQLGLTDAKVGTLVDALTKAGLLNP